MSAPSPVAVVLNDEGVCWVGCDVRGAQWMGSEEQLHHGGSRRAAVAVTVTATVGVTVTATATVGATVGVTVIVVMTVTIAVTVTEPTTNRQCQRSQRRVVRGRIQQSHKRRMR